MNKLKKITKKDVKSDEKVKDVFFNYFSRMGLYYPSNNDLGVNSPAWRANFSVRWSSDNYRRDAWQTVRAELKKVFPDELFSFLDKHYGPGGPAGSFVNGFTLEEKIGFCEMILSSDRSTLEMREAVKAALKYR